MAEPDDAHRDPRAALEEVEYSVRRALESGDDSGLNVLGYGEISLVVGWPSDQPTLACKRLPPFADPNDVDAYRRVFGDYLELLADRGVEPVESHFHVVDSPDNNIAYVVQPVLDATTLGPQILCETAPDPEHPLIVGVIDAVLRVCGDDAGLDAQVSNWAMEGDGRLRYLDVTTPMVFGSDGRPLLDIGVFLAAYPWALRGLLGRFVAPGVIAAYRDPRNVIVDFAANLWKERLQQWIPAVIQTANRAVSPSIDAAEVESYYRSDARLWKTMLALRRADRQWQRTVRRRTYPFLLPGKIDR